MKEDLSKKELENLQDSDFLISKRVITLKIESLLKDTYVSLKESIKDWKIDSQVINTSGKISKGESYKELPYFVLDYPRIFGEDTFSIRTVVLWGRHIGCYFIASGKFLETINIRKLMMLNEQVYISTGKTPWEHFIDSSNYKLVSDLDQKFIESMIKENSFLKIAIKIDLNEIPDLKDRVLSYSKLLTLFNNLT